MNNGYTVEPLVYVDENGEEQLSYDHANVQDHSFREAANRQHQYDQQYAIREDNAGNQYHAWDVENPEAYDEDAYQPQIEEEDDDLYSEEDIDSFINEEVYEACGGIEGYAELTEFAKENWTEQDIEAFNAAMDTNDIDLMRHAIDFLISDFNDAIQEQQDYDYWNH